MSVRVLHVADVHLGHAFPHLGEAAAVRRRDLVDTFTRICSLALEQRAAALIVAGDLFHSYTPPGSVVEVVQQQFERLENDDVRVYVVPGTHDSFWYRRSVWRQTRFRGAHVFTDAGFSRPQHFERDGLSFYIHGIAFKPPLGPVPLAGLQRMQGGINIATMHAAVDAPQEDTRDATRASLSRLTLLHCGMDYVALGGVHQRQTFARAGQVIASYPGSPEGLDQTETGQRHVALLEFSSGPPVVQFVPVQQRDVRAKRLNATGLTADQVAQRISALGGEDILLWLRLVGYPDELLDMTLLRDRVKNQFFWLDLDDQTRLSSSDFARRMANEATIGGEFVRAMRRRIDLTVDG
ncbi:MAG: DNA repair exonuclease [Chloroflexota bacterium]